MQTNMSEDARSVVEAGFAAVKKGENVEDAVGEAIGRLFRKYSQTGRDQGGPMDALQEIVSRYVHEVGPESGKEALRNMEGLMARAERLESRRA